MNKRQPQDAQPISRRKCIATSITAATVIPAALSSRAYAAGSDEIKVGLIGCGGRGTGAAAHAMSTGENVKIWAMADAFDDRLNSSRSSLQRGKAGNSKVTKGKGFGDLLNVPQERKYVGLDAYRRIIDSEIDMVILTGPPGYRPLHFEYAVKAGKHVFMEKPLASDAHGVRRIQAANEVAREKQLKVGVGLQRHHQATYQEAIRRIHAGEIGDVVSMNCYWVGGPPAKTAIPREDKTELEYQVRNWYFFDWLSGDHICEQHIHNIDICNWVKGEHPIKAFGMGGRQVRTGKEYGNIYDHHAVIFEYPDGTQMQSYCRQMPGCKNTVAERIDGTKGYAELGSNRCQLYADGNVIWESPRKRPKDYQSPYQVEWNELVKSILTDRPHNEVDYGATSTMSAILGRLATYSGKEIAWDDAYQSEKRLTTDAESWDAETPIKPQADGSYLVAKPGVTKVI